MSACRICSEGLPLWGRHCELCRMGRSKLRNEWNVCWFKHCQSCRKPIPLRAYYCQSCSLERWNNNPKVRGPALAAVAKAVRQGILPPAKALTCVDCGKPARDYDHRDYSKPLDVQPVCRSCNTKRGHAIQLQPKYPRAAA